MDYKAAHREEETIPVTSSSVFGTFSYCTAKGFRNKISVISKLMVIEAALCLNLDYAIRSVNIAFNIKFIL